MSSTITPPVLPVPAATEVAEGARSRAASHSLAAHDYRPDIDGLRAIAVGSVVLFHTFPRMMSGGFIGVDIFFVISGYLISTIILTNIERDSFSIVDFYRRRIRRIFPALLVVLLFCVLAGWLLLLQDEFRQLGKHIAGGTAFVQNFVLWGESGYFDNDPQSKPLLHLWSLAVEEQYYIFWPLLLVLACKRRWAFTGVIGAIAATSFGVSVWLAYKDPTAAFYSPASRFWELMVGGSLAYIALHRIDVIGRYGNVASAVGIALLLLGIVLTNPGRAFPGFWALLPTMGAFLLILAGPGAWINRSVLASRPFVACGLISYPLYLWHWPLLSLAHIVWPDNGHLAKVTLVLLSFLLASLTYVFVEKKLRWNRVPNLSALLLCGGLVLMLCGGLAIRSALVSPRIDYVNVAERGEWDFLAARSPGHEARDGIYPLHVERHATTMFIGDSHVAQYAERINDVEDRDPSRNGSIFAVSAGCPPIRQVYIQNFPADAACWTIRRDALAQAANSRVTSVVLGGFWSSYFDGHGYYFASGGKQLSLDTPEGRAAAFEELDREVKALQALHKTVYVLLDNPVGSQFDPHDYVPRFGPFDSRVADQLVQPDGVQLQIRSELIALAERNHAQIIDPESRLCVSGGCIRVTGKGAAVYKEASHLNPDWVAKHADYIDPAI